MDEAGWLGATDYLAMLIYLRGEAKARPDGAMPGLHCGAGYLAEGEGEKVSGRKLRMFAAALCRKWRSLPLDGASQAFLDVYEQFANDTASWQAVWEAGRAVGEAARHREQPAIGVQATWWTATPFGVASMGGSLAWAVADYVAKDSVAVTCKDATEEDRWIWGWSGVPDPLWLATRRAVEDEYPTLLREIVGNPFRPPPIIDPAWLAWNDHTVLKLAEAIYEQRKFEDLPILADALEDASCSDAALLGHLRGSGPHVRGCFALDLLLGKE